MDAVTTDLYSGSIRTVEDLIKDCTQLIERDAMVAGVGNRMRNPLLSVFLGADAIAHIPEIQNTYYSCWSAQAKSLVTLQGAYSSQQIEKAVVQASTAEGFYQTKRTIRIAWYWDIMDEGFEDQFQCVDQDFATPIGTALHRVFFIFCSQRDSQTQALTEQRLVRLISWAQEKNYTLVVLSDASGVGLLDAQGVTENYHLSASLVLLLNSAAAGIGDDNDIGKYLDFNMSQRQVWTASYRGCSKQFFDIIGVSLIRIIEKYQELARVERRNESVQDRLCQDGGDYLSFLDDVFEQTIAQHCPSDQQIGFWGDLPYTPHMSALERMLNGENDRGKGGLFKKLFGGRKDEGDPAYAIPSVGDFWPACVGKYYTGPVRAWLSSEAGLQTVTDYIFGKMTSVLTLNDMNRHLPSESVKIRTDPKYQSLRLERPRPTDGMTLPQYFHECARTEVKQQIYGELLELLAKIMDQLHRYAGGFGPLLVSVANSLQGIQMDENVRRAYGNHMERLAEENHDVLNRKIRPCGSEMELLQQLEQAFEELVKRDTDRIYYYTLQEDIDFQIRAGAATATNDVIATCFAFDLTEAGRLPTFSTEEGHLYCIMNNALKGLLNNVENQRIGKKFIVNRSDRIERLYLYPVDPETIMYH